MARGPMKVYTEAVKPTRTTTWSWTNWTFGLWWKGFKRSNCFGIDAGPLEVVWKWPTQLQKEHMAAFEARQRRGSR